MNLHPSDTQDVMSSGGTYNTNKDIEIKGFFIKAAGNVVYNDRESTQHTLTALTPYLVLPIGGFISLEAGTNVDVTVLL